MRSVKLGWSGFWSRRESPLQAAMGTTLCKAVKTSFLFYLKTCEQIDGAVKDILTMVTRLCQG